MKRYTVALLVLLCGCGTWGKKERPAPAPERRATPPVVQRQATPAPERRAAITPENTAQPAAAAVIEKSTSAPPLAPVVSRPRAQPTNGARKPDGVAASKCVVTRRVDKGTKNFDVLAKNACSFAIEVKAACLPSYAEANEPYPGTFTLDSWLFTLGHGQEQPERQSAMCFQRGGKVLYASCQIGIPYFTAPAGTKYGCYR